LPDERLRSVSPSSDLKQNVKIKNHPLTAALMQRRGGMVFAFAGTQMVRRFAQALRKRKEIL